MPDTSDLINAIVRGRLSVHSDDRFGFLATIDDRIWEVVGGGPQGLRDRRLSMVGLNPQPLPPHEAGRVLFEYLARAIIIVSGREAGSARKSFMQDIDDWCGTGWHPRFPLPGPWPGPDPRNDPRASWLFGGALAAAELAARYPAGEMQDVFAKAAQQLTEAALGTVG